METANPVPAEQRRRLATVQSYVREIEALRARNAATATDAEPLVAKYASMRAAVCGLNAPELAQERCRLAVGIREILVVYKACFSASSNGNNSSTDGTSTLSLCRTLLDVLDACAGECGGEEEARLVSEIFFILFATAPRELAFSREFIDALAARLEKVDRTCSTGSAKHVSTMLSLCIVTLFSKDSRLIINSNSKYFK